MHFKKWEGGWRGRMQIVMLSTNCPIVNNLVLLFQELLVKYSKTNIINILKFYYSATWVFCHCYCNCKRAFQYSSKTLDKYTLDDQQVDYYLVGKQHLFPGEVFVALDTLNYIFVDFSIYDFLFYFHYEYFQMYLKYIH